MLFQGPRETYNPQIHTEELSLTSQMNKDFAVHNKVLSRFERYTKFTSFLFHTGRIDGGARTGDKLITKASKEIHDNAYRVKYRSLNIKPAYAMGCAVVGEWFDAENPTPDMTSVTSVEYKGGKNPSNVVTDTLISIPIKHRPGENIYGDKFNPQDSIKLDSGLGSLIYITRIRRAATGDHFILDGKIIGKADAWNEEDLAEDEVLMEGGNYYGEGSMRGYQRHDQSYWGIFYSFISRYTVTLTGNAMDQREVVWCSAASQQDAMKKDKGEALWQYKQEWLADEMFGIMLELACRFSVSTMDSSTHSWFENSGKNLLTMANLNPEAGITPPRTSDGWVEQIKGTIDLEYDVNGGPGGFSAYMLEGIADVLASNSPAGYQGNTFIVLGDQVAYTNWDREMKKLVGWDPKAVAGGQTSAGQGHNTRIVQNITNGQNVKLGFNVQSYEYKGNEFIFMVDELMSHPGLAGRNGGLVGSGDMFILNVTPFEQGVSNFELFTRGQGRFFKKKYVDGMHSMHNESTMVASSGFDGAQIHYLAELFPIVYFRDTCCVIRGKGKYNGGALAGNAKLGNFPTII